MRRAIRRATTSKSVLAPGIIISITVGGGVLVITTISLVIFFVLRRRRARLQKMSHSEESFSETQQLFPPRFPSPRVEHVDGQDFVMVTLAYEDESLVSERERSKRAGAEGRTVRKYNQEREERVERIPKKTNGGRYERPPKKMSGERQERPPKKTSGERQERLPKKINGERQERLPRKVNGENQERPPRKANGERQERPPKKMNGGDQERTPKKSNNQKSNTRSVISSPTLKTLYLPSTNIIITPPTPISPRIFRSSRSRRPSILPNIDEVLEENADENENGDVLRVSAGDENEGGRQLTGEVNKERDLLLSSKGVDGELSFRQRVQAQRLQRVQRFEGASLSPEPSLETLRKMAIVERLMRGVGGAVSGERK